MSKAVEKNGSVFAIEDKYPVTPGHLLVIPIRHTPDWFSMTEGERLDADQLMRVLQATIRTEDKKVSRVAFLVSAAGIEGLWPR